MHIVILKLIVASVFIFILIVIPVFVIYILEGRANSEFSWRQAKRTWPDVLDSRGLVSCTAILCSVKVPVMVPSSKNGCPFPCA